MSLRTLIFGVIIVLLIAASSAAYLSLHFTESSILNLFPVLLVSSVTPAVHILLLEQLTGVFVLLLIFGVVIAVVLSSCVASPIIGIQKAVSAYAQDATRLPMPKLFGASKELKKLAADFASLTDKVEESKHKDADNSLVKTDFISTAAHQLRTPLTGIRWSLEALQSENLTPSQKELVDGAVEKSKQLVGIVGTLLDISGIESGKTEYVFKVTDISTVLSEVTRELSPLAQKKDVSLFYARDGSPLPNVRIDRERIKLVVTTLVNNAILYTPAKGTVRVTSDTNAGRVYVRITDTGIGIPENEQANIFERFYRAGNAPAKETQGNGLGLSIARSIASDHGGDLNFVTNKEGPGMTFVLALPVAV